MSNELYSPVAQSSEVVLIPAELLALGLRLVLTERLVDDRPDHVIVLHPEAASGATLSKDLKHFWRTYIQSGDVNYNYHK